MLIGRTRELEAAWNLLGRVSAGRGAMLVLAGEAGIGKTRLADEIAGRALQQGFTVAWARAWETGGAPAYFPWSELLLALQSTGFELPPAAAGIIYARASAGPGERAAVEPERQRFELFEHVLQHLRACARRAPLLLVFDDLQAADLASLELLAFVARGFRGLGIALLVTYRDVEARAGELAGVIGRIVREGEQLPLHRLSAEDVAELVRHEFGHFDAAFSVELHALTEGNPKCCARSRVPMVCCGWCASAWLG
jgi:predicted ATPase